MIHFKKLSVSIKIMNIIPRLENFNPNFCYVLGFDVDNSIYIEDKKLFFVSEMNAKYAKRELKNNKIKIKNIREFYDYIMKEKPKEIKLDYKGASIKMYEKLRGITKVKELKSIEEKRMKKEIKEVRKIRKAVKIAKEVLNNIEIKKGMKEKEIEKELRKEMIEKGVEPSFSPIIADLSNAKYPHYKTGNKRIEKGVLVDFGVKYEYYCSDLTRTMIFDKRGVEWKKYEKLKDIFFEIIDKIKEINTAGELYELSKKVFKRHKIKHPPHLIGHGIGLEVHEKPFPRKGSEESLEGSVMAIEPAYYGAFGLRFEENIYIRKSRVEIL